MKFSELGLAKRISDDLETLGFTEPTEIQEKAIPPILAGKDILASAETGSGKTAAYGLPIVQALRGGSKHLPRVLILVPTRELAVQVNDEINRFANKCGIRTATIYGGAGFANQARLLNRGVDVIVATPGRLFDHIEQGNAKLANVNMLVLDEADRMLDMGFTPQVRRIVSEITGPQRQTLMFSATINKAVARSGEEFLKDPVSIFVNSDRVEPASIEQKIHLVQEDGKAPLLISLLNEQAEPRTVLVFTKTRSRATKICKSLRASHISAGEIHSDISQNKRESTLKQFRKGEISVLVATDIAARGLDVPAISHVFNYDLPLSAADYVHRIGRTGRAGRSGIAVSFVSDEQRYLVRDIEKVTGRTLDPNSPFSASRSNDSRGRSRNHKNGVRRDRPQPGFRRDRPQSEAQGDRSIFGERSDKPKSAVGRDRPQFGKYGDKPQFGSRHERTQPEERGDKPQYEARTRADSSYTAQGHAGAGSYKPASKRPRTTTVIHEYKSNRAEKYLQGTLSNAVRTPHEDRVSSQETAAAPRPRFDKFKKKRADGTPAYGRVEGSNRGTSAGPSGGRSAARTRPDKDNSQDRNFEYRGVGKRTS